MNNKQYISDLISKEDINKWNYGDIISVTAPTGSGKSYFILNVLKEYCKENNKKILLLTNRNILKEQFLMNIDERDKIITIKNYQSIENSILNNKLIDAYDYIVCDEHHYFFNDVFNFLTDLSYNYILNLQFSVKILLSATSTVPLAYLEENKKLDIIKYNIDTDYKYIEKLYFYNDDDVILKLLNELPDDEKALYFTKARIALDFSKQVEDSAFICSEYNNQYADEINKEEKANIIENEKFNCKVLCTTITLDNGVNIKDNKLKHIIIDTFDLDTIQQCLGRKRITDDNDNVTVYIKDWSNKRLNGKKQQIINKLVYANKLKNGLSSEELVSEYKHKSTYGKLIYDYVEDGRINKKVNDILYFKYNYNINEIDKYMADSYMGYVSERLKQKEYYDLEQEVDAMTLEDKLNKMVGIKMFKDEQENFKNFLLEELYNTIKTNHGSLGLNSINGYFRDNDISFVLSSKEEKIRKSKEYGKRYWILGKIDFNL